MNNTPMVLDLIFRTLRRGIVGSLMLIAATALVAFAKPGNGGGNPGKGKGHSEDVVPPGHDPSFVPPGQRRAPIEVAVKAPPPPLRTEVVLVRPSPRHVWVPGYWVYETSYVWVPGAWILPPEPAAVWVAPRVEMRSGVSIFVSGYWRL